MRCMLFVMYGGRFFSTVSAITERSEMALYEMSMFMSFLGFGMFIYVCQPPCAWNDVVVYAML